LTSVVYSERETNRAAQLIVQMDGQTTILVNPKNIKDQPKTFTFDHSYWSHDQFTVRDDGCCEPSGSKYADQVLRPSSLTISSMLAYPCVYFTEKISTFVIFY